MRIIALSVALLGGIYLVMGGTKGQEAAPRHIASASLVDLESPVQKPPVRAPLNSTARHLLEQPSIGPARPMVIGEALPLVQQVALQSIEGGDLRRVSARVANVRLGPSTKDKVVGRLSRGDEVLVLNRQAGWLEIAIEGDGVLGWVAESLFAQ